MIMSNTPLPQAIVDRIERGRAAEQARIEAEERERQEKEARLEQWFNEAVTQCMSHIPPELREFCALDESSSSPYTSRYKNQSPVWLFVIRIPSLLPIGIHFRLDKPPGIHPCHDVRRNPEHPWKVHEIRKVFDSDEDTWHVTDLDDWRETFWKLRSYASIDEALFRASVDYHKYQKLLVEVETINATDEVPF
jgi:hypothetical protein